MLLMVCHLGVYNEDIIQIYILWFHLTFRPFSEHLFFSAHFTYIPTLKMWSVFPLYQNINKYIYICVSHFLMNVANLFLQTFSHYNIIIISSSANVIYFYLYFTISEQRRWNNNWAEPTQCFSSSEPNCVFFQPYSLYNIVISRIWSLCLGLSP